MARGCAEKSENIFTFCCWNSAVGKWFTFWLGQRTSSCISINWNLFASRRQNFHLAWVNRRRLVRLIFQIPRRSWRQSPLGESPRSRKRNDFLSSHREIGSITRRGTKNISLWTDLPSFERSRGREDFHFRSFPSCLCFALTSRSTSTEDVAWPDD